MTRIPETISLRKLQFSTRAVLLRMSFSGLLLGLLGACSFSPDPLETIGSLPGEVPEPADNQSSEEKVELGRLLFWDPLLSGERDVACASCHHPDFAYADGLAFPMGTGGKFIAAAKNTPTVLGTAFNGLTVEGQTAPEEAPMFWDNRAQSLEGQALGPLKNVDEMRGPHFSEDEILEELVSRLTEIPEYVTLFESAFGAEAINPSNLAKAIAAFERTLVPLNSSFDRFMAGDNAALTSAQIRGMHGFVYQGCAGCHSGPMFSDYKLHVIPVPARAGETTTYDGLYGVVYGEFRTPSLRMVTRTAPYMHNGVFTTLSEALEVYHNADHFIEVDEQLQGDVEVAHSQGDDMLSFLESLSDGTYDITVPERVPSGLPPGGL